MPRGRGGSSDDVGRGLSRPGPDGLPHPGTPHDVGQASGHEQVSEIQRARLLAAMTQVVSERGAPNVTVARVVARSGVSRRTFYELFEDREDCFLAAFDDAIARIASEVVPVYEGATRTQRAHSWRAKIRAALIALLEFLDDEPGMGRLVIVETLGAGPRALERRARVLAQVIAIVDEGRLEAKRSDGPPPLTAEGVVGGVFSLVHSRLLEGRDGPLVGLVNPLMAMIVLPYLGQTAARKELQRPVPKASNKSRRNGPDPLRELPMRLTYRTVRVLMAVAALGGQGSYPSNRQVADAAGIKDQGQISKLLARLKGLGLIEQTRRGPARGGPNAWALTAKGREVEGAITQQTGRS
jgi:AcrR family transcriptional regulator/DNA-binding MarR family transcriptional regulator